MQKKKKGKLLKNKEVVSKKKPVKNEKENDEMQELFFEMIRSGEYTRAHPFSSLKKADGHFFLSDQNSGPVDAPKDNNVKPSLTLIFSLYLPIKVDLETGEIIPNEEIDFAYQIFFEMQERDEWPPYLWVGGLQQDIPSEKQEMVKKALYKVSCHPVFFDSNFQEKYIENFLPNIYMRGFDGDITTAEDFNEKAIMGFQSSLFSNYFTPVQSILESERDPMILIFGAHMVLLPRMIKKTLSQKGLQINRMVSFVSECFPAHTITKIIPCFSKTVLVSMLKCTLIVFEKHSHAKNFFALVKKSLGLDFSSINGGLCIENFHNRVAVHIKNIGVSLRLVRELLGDQESPENSKKNLVSIPEVTYSSRLEAEEVPLLDYKGSEREIGVMSVSKSSFQWNRTSLEDVEVKSTQIIGENEENPYYVIQDSVFSKLKLKSIQELLNMFCTFLGGKGIRSKVLVILSIKPGGGVSWPMAAKVIQSLNSTFEKQGNKIHLLQEESLSISTFSSILLHCQVYILLGTGKLYPSLLLFLYIHVNKEPKCGIALHSCQINEFLKSITPVNPLMIVDVMRAIESIIDLPNCRKFFAWNSDKMYVTQHTSREWLSSILKYSLKEERKGKDIFGKLTKVNMEKLKENYQAAKRRLIILNYEGVLVDPSSFSYVATNGNQMSRISSPMTDQVKRILKALIKDPNNTVFLLTGKKKDSIEHWVGDLVGLGLGVEYGYFYKLDAGETQWKHLCNMNWSWMETVKNIMVHYVARTDGSFIEYKNSGIVWRFVEREDDYGKNQAIILADHLKSILQPVAANDIEVYIGNSYVEVRPMSLNKVSSGSDSQVIQKWENRGSSWTC